MLAGRAPWLNVPFRDPKPLHQVRDCLGRRQAVKRGKPRRIEDPLDEFVMGRTALVNVTEIGGVVVHAELDFGVGRLQIGEPNPDYHLVPAPTGDDDCYSLGLYCADADGLVARAEQRGATIREPLSTFVSGDRYASIRDPYGVRWSVMTRIEDLSEEESTRRVADWASTQS